jgi:methylmalonyl-CoA mutase N-terminal domain/subunit
VANQHLARLKDVKKSRNAVQVEGNLRDLRMAAENEANLMPYILSCVKSYATLGEITDTLKEVFGEYEEPIDF